MAYRDQSVTVHVGNCLEKLKELPANSVHCCVTSPPYWNLRDYGTAEWEGGDEGCDHQQPESWKGNSPDYDSKQKTNPGSFGYRQWLECGKCGAKRIDQQLGLEKTPEEYVQNMVEVFREVRRILRDDGTLWLNIGDSYAGSGAGGGGNRKGNEHGQHDDMAAIGRPRPSGDIKPKDLCGIPWRVAMALQKPYYTGSIKDERDRIWLAAMIDAEGCIFIHKRKAGRDNGQGYKANKDSYGSGLEISNTSEAIVQRVAAIVGKGSICTQGPEQNARRRQTIYRWNLRSNECREILREVYPHLVGKQHEARLAIGCPVDGPKAIAAHKSLKALHNGQPATIDFNPPETMFEQGWYLRQDIIWAKKNCMPESVTDRCTKAHEYIFLLSKSAKYYYDAEAISEPLATPPHKPGNNNASERTAGPNNRGGKSQWDDTHEREWGKRGFRNKRSVWTVATQPFPDAHFATFPPKLIEPCVLAGCPEGGTVLDPFLGSGTTAEVAKYNGRNCIGIELNSEYLKFVKKRLKQEILF